MSSGELVLPGDLLVLPVERLAEEVRRRFTWTAGDFALTRPRLRTASRVIDSAAAELLRQFTAPSTVVEAVIRHSREHGLDPETTLDAAYPLLLQLVREGFLIDAAAAASASIEASWRASESVAGLAVLRCVQVLEDTEVYQVRQVHRGRPAGGGQRVGGPELALKIERPAAPGAERAARRQAARPAAARLVREAAILDHLARGAGAPVAPRLHACGAWQGRRFLVQEWCAGVEALVAAGELRERGTAGRPALAALCREVAGAFARLHARGVVHGDVHQRNVLVAADGRVWLIDFGLARWRQAPPGLPAAGRGGVAFAFEPEYAAAVLAGTREPAARLPTAAGEQYAVAALLYQMVTGAHYVDFSLERESLLRQIAGSPPLPFAALGQRPWPELEAVLGRALAKSPAERFAGIAELAAALGEVGVAAAEGAQVGGGAPEQGTEAGAAPARDGECDNAAGAAGRGAGEVRPEAVPSLSAALRRGSPGEELLAATLARLRPGGTVWRQGLAAPPVASVQYGAAGIAHALYRVALVRQDAELLAQADLWSARARATAAADDAFFNPHLGLTPETIGQVSLYHTEPGLRCVEALIAQALGDTAGAARAVDGYVAAARLPCPNSDLALGRAGLLLGCALLLPALWPGQSELGAGAGGGPRRVGVGAAGGARRTGTGTAGDARRVGAGAAGGAGIATGDAPGAHRADAALTGGGTAAGQALRQLGDELLAGLWREIAARGPIGDPAARSNLGIAHGWAGLLHATLRWCQAAGRPLPAALPARLAELGACAEGWGRGRRWRWHAAPAAPSLHLHPAARGGLVSGAAGGRARWMAGWCNGSAGMVHLWTLAGRLLDDAAAWQLAVGAAWHAWEAGDGGESLCCGLAGRAYALLDLHRRGGGEEWLARARALAERAAAGALAGHGAPPPRRARSQPDSLYRGQLGVALLAADLENPRTAAMPLFGDEGWDEG